MSDVCQPTGEWSAAVVASTAANADTLPVMPPHLETDLECAASELDGSGRAAVIRAARWRWVRGELQGAITLRRSDNDGGIWDLICSINCDPDSHGESHVSVVARHTTEAREASGQCADGLWWVPATTLRSCEREAIGEAVQDALEHAERDSFRTPECGVVPLAMLGLVGELRVVTELGLAYVRAARGSSSSERTALALKADVLAGYIPVPDWVRRCLFDSDSPLPLLAVVGGDL